MRWTFDDINDAGKDHDDQHHHHQKNKNRSGGAAQNGKNFIELGKQVHQPEDPENPEYSEQTDDHQRRRLRKQKSDVGGHNRQQINDAPKAQDIGRSIVRTPDACDVLEGKQGGEAELCIPEAGTHRRVQLWHRIQYDHGNAEQNGRNQRHVETAARKGPGAKNNDFQPALQRALTGLRVFAQRVGLGDHSNPSRLDHTASSIRGCAAAVGWMPSACMSSGSSATDARGKSASAAPVCSAAWVNVARKASV